MIEDDALDIMPLNAVLVIWCVVLIILAWTWYFEPMKVAGEKDKVRGV